VSSGGGRAHIQGESDMPTSTRVEGDLGDGLTLYQSHSYRFLREEVVVPDIRGA